MAKEKVKTLSAMEAELRSTEYFGKGIKVASGFDLGTAAPLDTRSIVKTLSARDKFATDKIAYEGMQVYVEEDQKQYIFKNGEWVEFGFNASDADDVVKGSIVNDLTTGGADKALSAEQGKVLKEQIDDVKDLLSNKNSNTQVFETADEFTAWVEEVEPKVGDLVFIVEHKRAYIYKGVAAIATLAEPFAVPEGWVLFDEISTEVDLVNYAKVETLEAEVSRATQAEAALQEAVKEEETARTEAVTKALTDAKAYTDEAIENLNSGALADRVTILEEEMDAVEADIETINGKLAQEVLDRQAADEELGKRMDQLELDLIENAQAIVAIEARRFILTRSQEVITIEADKLVYPITMPNGGNAIVDVIKNSTVLVSGVDYTYNNREITFMNQYAVGTQIYVLKTYNDIAPSTLPEMNPVVGNATVGNAIVG